MIQKKVFRQGTQTWVNMTTENRDELNAFYKEYGIADEITEYSLDRNERARLEYEQLTHALIVIFNVPTREKIDDHYETVPMTFIVKNQVILTITNSKNQYVTDKLEQILEQTPNLSLLEFLFRSLFVCTDVFFPYIEELDTQRATVHQKLKQKTSKQNLLLLSDLEIGVVFFVSAAKQNAALLDQIRTHELYQSMSNSEKEALKNVLTEAQQLFEMTQFSEQILKQLSGTYNNILNNTLNETMRILTIFSVLLTIPTIITGFFGMNMPLPLQDNTFGWLITIALSTALWFLLSWILQHWMK